MFIYVCDGIYIRHLYIIGLDSQKIKKKPLFALCLCTLYYITIYYINAIGK